MTTTDLLLGQVPEELRARPEEHNLGADQCLFSVGSDLAMDGTAQPVWLIVTGTKVFAIPGGDPAVAPVTGPDLSHCRQRLSSISHGWCVRGRRALQ